MTGMDLFPKVAQVKTEETCSVLPEEMMHSLLPDEAQSTENPF